MAKSTIKWHDSKFAELASSGEMKSFLEEQAARICEDAKSFTQAHLSEILDKREKHYIKSLRVPPFAYGSKTLSNTAIAYVYTSTEKGRLAESKIKALSSQIH